MPYFRNKYIAFNCNGYYSQRLMYPFQLKAEIQTWTKPKVTEITNEQPHKMLEQGSKEDKENFFMADHQSYSTCHCHVKCMRPPA